MKLSIVFTLILLSSHFVLADSMVIKGHEPVNWSLSSGQNSSWSSYGSLSRDDFSESKGVVSINSKVDGFEVPDSSRVKYPNLTSVKLSIAVAPLQNSLAVGTSNKDLEKIKVKGTVELFSGTKKDTESITCRLYNGDLATAKMISSDRLLECWADKDKNGLDTPKFQFYFDDRSLSAKSGN